MDSGVVQLLRMDDSDKYTKMDTFEIAKENYGRTSHRERYWHMDYGRLIEKLRPNISIQ